MEPTRFKRASSILTDLSAIERSILHNKHNKAKFPTERDYYKALAKVQNRQNVVKAIMTTEIRLN